MTFIWPVMLFSLALLPMAIALYLIMQRQRRARAASYGSLGLLQGGTGRKLGARRHVPPALFLIGLAILLVSLARPQAQVSLPKIQGTVILAFDVSGSMAADDLKPTRMDAAKTAARDFVQRQPTSVQIGVVAFSDNGFSIQQPTNDQESILAAIDRLSPQRGTSVGNGINASLNTIATSLRGAPTQPVSGEPPSLSNRPAAPTPSPTPFPKGTYTSAVIVMLTDGENNENPDPLAAAQTASDRGVRIYTVGLGSPAGILLHVNGITVRTRLDEATLKQIAQITGGSYYNAQTGQDLRNIYDTLDPQLTIKPEKMEVTALFAGASVLVMLVAGLLSLLWFSRLP